MREWSSRIQDLRFVKVRAVEQCIIEYESFVDMYIKYGKWVYLGMNESLMHCTTCIVG